MRLTRIYFPFSVNSEHIITITDEKAHYLRSVLRFKSGQKLHIFNHLQQEFLAEILAINKKGIELKLINKVVLIEPSKLCITLVQSLSKGERMDYSIQKATELGINTIQPLFSEYSEVKLKGERLTKKIKHWQNIAISASEQSFRADIPTILSPIKLEDYTKIKQTGMFLQPNESQTINQCAKNNWVKFDVVVGPEGGWSHNDLDSLQKCGLQGIRFGQRILRTETMAPALLAAIHALWGDFK